MGSGIAEVAAKTGHEVVLRSRKQETPTQMVASITKSLAKQVERGKLRGGPRRRPRAGHRHRHIGDLADCDLVIESVVEDLDVKKELFAELDGICKDGRRSSPPTPPPCRSIDMAVKTQRPDKVCGVHFFNPAPMMSAGRDRAAAHRQRRDHRRGHRVRRRLRQGPGRGQGPRRLHRERTALPVPEQRVRMLENGTASRDDIDTAMKGGCNFPMGPLALLDLVGLDTSLRSSTPSTTSSATRTTPPCPPCAAWWPPASSAASRHRLLRLPQVAHTYAS
jgi:3-hydroxybutyryl-CoA dehydrogenase